MKTVTLDKKKHDRIKFDCGIKPLNNYLRQMANQQCNKDNTRTFVLELKTDNSIIIGFYILTMTTINLTDLPEQLQKKHQNNTSAGLIARLAIDKKYKGKGFGQWLLIDALKKLHLASQSVAFPLVVVDAKDGTKEFYQKFGFKSFDSKSNKLFITIADIQKNIL